MTRARVELPVVVARAQPRWPCVLPPSGSSTHCSRRAGPSATSRATARSPGAASAAPAVHRRGEEAWLLRGLPGVLRRGELFDRLREWRKGARRGGDVPAFVVFTDATLQLIAEQSRARQALLRISGIGHRSSKRYGEDVPWTGRLTTAERPRRKNS